MLAQDNTNTSNKRSLKKVRAQFLHKKGSYNDLTLIDPATKYLGENAFMLQPSLGLVEINRKICSGPQYLNSYFNISSPIIETKLSNRIVTLNLAFKTDKDVLPWEYTTKRLESYGDLELATLAHRMRKFNTTFNTIVSSYEESLRSKDSTKNNSWNEAKARALNTCQEIEKNHSFYKVLLHFTRDSNQILATSYSEGLLQEIGFKPQDFVKWTQKNGMPTVFDASSSVFHHATKVFFEFMVFLGSQIQESMEYETELFDAKGSKSKVIVQSVKILEPVADGFLCHSYFIVKNRDSINNKQDLKDNSLPGDFDIGSKFKKTDSEQELEENKRRNVQTGMD